ncbi:MAG: electron transport complex subunit RsxE [Planctomycetota bacterium]
MKLRSFTDGIIKNNALFVLMLGCCPTLAVTNGLQNAVGMAAAATFVLVGSNVMIAMFKRVIPDKIRIPCYIVIIATFVTVVELVMKGWFPALERNLGIFIPLIVVNCIILARAEAFANKNSVADALLDGLGIGLGYLLSLCLIASIRELIGAGQLWGVTVTSFYSAMEGGVHIQPASIFVLAPGAFIVLGILFAVANIIKNRRNKAA